MNGMGYTNMTISNGLRKMWDSLRQNKLYESLPGEFWKPVKYYDGFYEISTYMRVKDVLRNKILNQRINGDGYWQVSLRVNGVRQQKRPHRLFAESFMLNPENKECINHKNLIKTDNIPCNIEWSTVKENNQHAAFFGALPTGESVKHSKLSTLQVMEIYNSCDSAGKLAKRFGVTERAIVKIKKGISWKSITKTI
jgi:hypothetical protein